MDKSQKKWQKNFLKKVFSKKRNSSDNFVTIILNDPSVLEAKQLHFPKSFCKYYAPTSNNIIDVQQQRVWMASPSSFNDPFDCSVGCDVEEYEKQCLLKFIKENNYIMPGDSYEGISPEEYVKIINSTTNWDYVGFKKESYSSLIWKLLENKEKVFSKKIRNYQQESRKIAESKVERLRNNNIRIACFSEYNSNAFYKNIQMWSHYAENHRGFCIEFEIPFLKERIEFEVDAREAYSNKEEYLNERLMATIQGSLFPVIYTGSRVNIPVTKHIKLCVDDITDNKYTGDIDMLLYKAFITKSANWSYEKEWRLIINGDLSSYYDNKLPFPYFKKIFLGCRMESQPREALIGIAKELDIEAVDLIMDNKKFVLEEQRVEHTDWRKNWYREITNPFIDTIQ